MKSQSSTIVITGVTRGLGRAMVAQFVRRGHAVFGCARTVWQIEEMSRTYPRHDFQAVDVASEKEVKSWAERVLKKAGGPDFVINNAAVLNAKASLWEVQGGDFSNEIDINIKGIFNVIRHFVPAMVDRKQGVIVNFTSRWGTKFERQMAPYCATKWAVVALTRVLAEELKPTGVAAVGLNPGIVKTAMLRKYLDATDSTDLANYPTPAEWAQLAVPYILRLCRKDSGKLRTVFDPLKRTSKPSNTREAKPRLVSSQEILP